MISAANDRTEIEMVALPPDLLPSYVAAFRCMEGFANRGEYIRQCDIDDAIGSHNSSGSTQAGICAVLESRGLIKRFYYQRGRQIMIVETGKMTAAPVNKTPHWRTMKRPASTPTAQLHPLRQRKPDVAAEIIRAAHREGMKLDDFIAELVWTGWQDRAAALGEGA